MNYFIHILHTKNHLYHGACFSYLKKATVKGCSSWKTRDLLHIDNIWIRVTWLSISHTVTSRVLRSSSVNSFISCCWDCMYYEKDDMQWNKFIKDSTQWGEDMGFMFEWHALSCEILFLPRNPYMGYIGTCRGKGYGFWGSRSLNRVSFLTLL